MSGGLGHLFKVNLLSIYGVPENLSSGLALTNLPGLLQSLHRALVQRRSKPAPGSPTSKRRTGPPTATERFTESQGHESWPPRRDSQTPGLAGRAGPGQPRQAEAGPRPPRGRAYPSGEYSRLKTAPWVRVLRYTESAGWMDP